jgi:hypothetical protein
MAVAKRDAAQRCSCCCSCQTPNMQPCHTQSAWMHSVHPHNNLSHPKHPKTCAPRPCKTVPGTGEVARFPVETLGTHKDGNTEHNVTSNGAPHRHPDPDISLAWMCKLS